MKSSKKLEIRPRNYEEVIHSFETTRPDPKEQEIAFNQVSRVFQPRTFFLPGAREQIAALEPGFTVIANHRHNADPTNIASAAKRSSALQGLWRRQFVLTKAELFNVPVVGDKLTEKMRALGAVPVFRGSDFKRDKITDAAKIEKINAAMAGLYNSLLNGTVSSVTTEGGITAKAKASVFAPLSLVVFPEGTRNKTNPTQVQGLKRGFDALPRIARRREHTPIVSMSIHYEGTSLRDLRSPIIVIGNPLMKPFSSDGTRSRDVVAQDWARTELQTNLDLGIAIAMGSDTTLVQDVIME
jgi:1-acyl-sn-glycerol-3-phosphate acyltransferase